MSTKPNFEEPEFEIETEAEPEHEQRSKPEVEIVDDTPPEDRDRGVMPKEIVAELEADELEEYSDKVKTRLKQLKRVWHDERREKERYQREQNEALSAAQRYRQEAEQLRRTLTEGEGYLLDSYKQSAEYEVKEAERAYRDAYESGDTDRIVEAQRKMTTAALKAQQLSTYKPTLQAPEEPVQQSQEQYQVPRPDDKTVAWQERNQWYGADAEMTAAALGLHQKLVTERGAQFAGSDEYWQTIDKTMGRRFPEYFGESEKQVSDTPKPKPAAVVAPASRSTSPKKIVLKQSQLMIAKKLGLTPEQYAREVMKMER